MITISYGIGNSQTRDESHYASIGSVLNDTSLQAALGFDPNEVDARVNGCIVEPSCPVPANLRIELVKKAGKKSNVDALTLENQLRPIGISPEVLKTLDQKVKDAMEPVYANLNKIEFATAKAVKGKQFGIVKSCEPFIKYTEALINRLVDTNYVDNVGGLTVPVAIREVLAKIADDADLELEEPRAEVRKAERASSSWLKSVIADIGMSVTVADQRVLVAKALHSNPLEAWVFEA